MRRFLRALPTLALIGAVGVAALFGFLWIEHRTAMTLPAPTGPLPVGRTTAAWVNPITRGELLIWIWYPAAPSPSARPAAYLPAPWSAALARYTGVLLSEFLNRDPSVVHTHSLADAAVSPKEASWPVVIVRAGGGALTTDFTTLAEDLASHGYVVVGFDAPYRTVAVVLSSGRVVMRPPENNPETLNAAGRLQLINRLLAMWTDDTKFVVDELARLNSRDPGGRFTGRLDLRRLGMFGHSFGGATALQFCHDDARCKAGIDLDGAPYGSVVKDSLRQPFLFLLSDHGDFSSPEDRAVFADIHSIDARIPQGALLLVLRGANHFSFSDQILLKSQLFVKLAQSLQGGVDGRRGLRIAADCVRAFFDVHLRNAPATSLDNLRRAWPELRRVS